MATNLSGSVRTLADSGAPKPRGVMKLELEIEKIRSECNWRRGRDLTQQQVIFEGDVKVDLITDGDDIEDD